MVFIAKLICKLQGSPKQIKSAFIIEVKIKIIVTFCTRTRICTSYYPLDFYKIYYSINYQDATQLNFQTIYAINVSKKIIIVQQYLLMTHDKC